MITQQNPLFYPKQKYNKMLILSKMNTMPSGKTNYSFRRLQAIDELKKYDTSKILVIHSKESDKEFLEKISGGKFITSFDGKEYWYFKEKKSKTFILLKFNIVKCEMISQAKVNRYNESKKAKRNWYQQFSDVYKQS